MKAYIKALEGKKHKGAKEVIVKEFFRVVRYPGLAKGKMAPLFGDCCEWLQRQSEKGGRAAVEVHATGFFAKMEQCKEFMLKEKVQGSKAYLREADEKEPLVELLFLAKDLIEADDATVLFAKLNRKRLAVLEHQQATLRLSPRPKVEEPPSEATEANLLLDMEAFVQSLDGELIIEEAADLVI